jgi:hypothetical protein
MIASLAATASFSAVRPGQILSRGHLLLGRRVGTLLEAVPLVTY